VSGRPSPSVAEKALRLLAQHRVLSRGSALVGGDSGLWSVEALPDGVVCSCPAGANLEPASCSHKLAAMIAWAELDAQP
jgi:hypothetical protein